LEVSVGFDQSGRRPLGCGQRRKASAATTVSSSHPRATATDTVPTTSAAAAAAATSAHPSTRRDRAARIAAAVGAATRELRLPVVRTDATRVAEIARRSQQSYLAFLAEVLIPTLRPESHVAAATGGWLRSRRP
jgi:hypothetical protein